METRQVFGSREVAWQKRTRVYFCSQCGGRCEEKLVYGEPRDVCTACGHTHAARPRAAVAVLVVDEGRVLLCKRAAALKYGGRWCLPSGAIEFDEDFLTAGRRETEEFSSLSRRLGEGWGEGLRLAPRRSLHPSAS
jgi:NADH pyrophosphatase NudC (nudix superfamily)